MCGASLCIHLSLCVCVRIVLTTTPPLQVLADVKKVITDEDLLGLVGDNMDTADAAGWEVLDLHVSGAEAAAAGGRGLRGFKPKTLVSGGWSRRGCYQGAEVVDLHASVLGRQASSAGDAVVACRLQAELCWVWRCAACGVRAG